MLSVILMSVFMPSAAVLSVIMLNGIKLIVFMQIDIRMSIVRIRNFIPGKMAKKIWLEKFGGKKIGGKKLAGKKLAGKKLAGKCHMTFYSV